MSGWRNVAILLAAGSCTGAAGCSRRQPADPTNTGGAQCEARSSDPVAGTLHTVQRYDYDPAGRVVRAEWEYHEFIETRGAVRTFEYDANSRVAVSRLDEDLDGKPETTERYVYDKVGRLERKESVTAPSTIVFSADYKYDDAGRRSRTDWENRGAVTAFETVAYAPDGKQRTVSWFDASGKSNHRTRFDLDDHGNVLRTYELEGSPETPKLTIEFHYNSAGRLESEATYDETGTKALSVTVHHYNAGGALETSDLSYNGGPSLHTTYSYRGHWKVGRCGDLPSVN